MNTITHFLGGVLVNTILFRSIQDHLKTESPSLSYRSLNFPDNMIYFGKLLTFLLEMFLIFDAF